MYVLLRHCIANCRWGLDVKTWIMQKKDNNWFLAAATDPILPSLSIGNFSSFILTKSLFVSMLQGKVKQKQLIYVLCFHQLCFHFL